MDNRGMPEPLPTPHDYRMHPALAARFVGAGLVALALVMFGGTALVAVAGWSGDLLLVPLVLGVVGVITLGWWLRSRAYVLRADAEGYHVRLVRGAGVRDAAWRDVESAATSSPRGIPCLVLHLSGGGTTTIPVQAVAIDREQLVREVQRRLDAGRGLRRLGDS